MDDDYHSSNIRLISLIKILKLLSFTPAIQIDRKCSKYISAVCI